MTPSLTPFAGLEVLDPGDPFSSDGFRFQSINPQIEDRLLQIGAVLHRHDEHAALADPATLPVVAVDAAGGVLPADTVLGVAFTWVDSQGGETLPSATVTDTTPPGLSPPQLAPVLTPDYSAGALLAASYTYAATVADGLGGETTIGPASTVVVDPGHANARVTVGGLKALLAEVTEAVGAEWRLWRQREGGVWYLMGQGVGETFEDEGEAGDCTVEPPERGTTKGTNKLKVTVPGPAPADAEFFRIYVGVDDEFVSPCLVAQYPVAEVGVAQPVVSLALATGLPPAVSTCYSGAHKIDPDTELLEWTWKRPVSEFATLPAVGNTEGDVRVTLDTMQLWAWSGTEWVNASAGTKTWLTTHTFALRGSVAAEPPIPAHDIELGAGQSAHLLGVRYKLLSGTSFSFRIQLNGADVPGLGTAGAPLKAEAAAASSLVSEPIALASHDELGPLISAVAGAPAGGKVTLVIANTV